MAVRTAGLVRGAAATSTMPIYRRDVASRRRLRGRRRGKTCERAFPAIGPSAFFFISTASLGYNKQRAGLPNLYRCLNLGKRY